MAYTYKSKADVNLIQKKDVPSIIAETLEGLPTANMAVETVQAKQNVITASAATLTLTGTQSGSLVLLSRAAGSTITLPTPVAGTYFDFVVATTVTSNSYAVITATPASQFLRGQLLSIDTDSSNALAAYTANGTTHVRVLMDGTTTGGRVGTSFRLTAISSTIWQVDGIVNASGAVATPFAVAP